LIVDESHSDEAHFSTMRESHSEFLLSIFGFKIKICRFFAGYLIPQTKMRALLAFLLLAVVTVESLPTSGGTQHLDIGEQPDLEPQSPRAPPPPPPPTPPPPLPNNVHVAGLAALAAWIAWLR